MAFPEERRGQHFNTTGMQQESTRKLPEVWGTSAEVRGVSFLSQRGLLHLISMPHAFVSCISLSKQQFHKILLKGKGLLFTLARRLLLLENKRDLYLHPHDFAIGTLFTV